MVARRIQRFEVIDELGRGGMGAVYRARDPQLEREVAIKVLAGSAASNELSIRATLDLRAEAPHPDELLAEARMMARLSHPNVLPIYEVGLDDNAVFLVMEYVPGCNARKWLAEPRTQAQILAVYTLAALGLAAAHARGIVHRDFKPDNVLIGTDGRVCVCDFGISGLVAPSAMASPQPKGVIGTLKYMAPELFDRGEASAASDVFALCRAIAEAFHADQDPRELRARGLPPELAELVIAGLHDDPAARPHLMSLILALDRHPPTRPRRRPWLAFGAAAIGIGSFAVVLVLMRGQPAQACVEDRTLLAGRWDAARSQELRAALVHDPADTEQVARIAAIFDGEAEAIIAARAAACEGRRSGEITVSQETMRASCLERRAIELGASVHHQLVRTGRDFAQRARLAAARRDAVECTELIAPPLPPDRAPVIALYDRFALSDELASAAELVEVQAIEREAKQRDELELEARAALDSGSLLRSSQHLHDSDDALQRAYKIGLAIKSAHLQAAALVERSLTASSAGDTVAAESLAKLALTVADNPTVDARDRARILGQLGHAEKIRSEITAAIGHLDQALDVLAKAKIDSPGLEIVFRADKVDALLATDSGTPAALRLAHDTVEYARQASGEDSDDYANAAHQLAYALEIDNEYEAALGYRRRVVAVLAKTDAPDHQAVVDERIAIATDLLELGDIEAARVELADLRELCETNPDLAKERATVLESLGSATFEVGHYDAGIRILERALDESVSQYGKDQLETLGTRTTLASYLIELERYDEVTRHIRELDAGYRSHSERTDVRLAGLHGTLAADVAISRGDPRAGEQLARHAIEELDELKAPDSSRQWVLYQLARSLVEQHKYDQAQPLLVQVREISDSAHDRADNGAVIDIQLARVQLGTGHRAEGLALARNARDVLARFPGQRRARIELDALLHSIKK